MNFRKYKDNVISFLQTLIQTPSVNGIHNEKKIIKHIALKAGELNLEFKLYESKRNRPNILLGTKEALNKNDNLLLVAHSDTVPVINESAWKYKPFSGKIKNGKIYGRGALDCKGGIALSIYILKALSDSGLKDKAKLLIGADEESGASSKIGIHYVLEQGIKAKGAVYTYGWNIKPKLTIGHRGLLRIWVTCHGEAIHTGSKDWQKKFKGVNAIRELTKFIEEASKIDYNVTNEFFPDLTFNLTPTLIEGGIGESIVPPSAKVLLDIRTIPDLKNKKIINDLKKIGSKLSDEQPSFSYEIKNNVPAALSNPQSHIVKIAKEIMKEIYDFSEEIKLKGAGPTNESYMLIEKGIPTITGFGPTGDGFHSINEYAEIKSFENSFKFLFALAKQF